MRFVTRVLAWFALVLGAHGIATAQAPPEGYPSRPVRLIVSSVPGGGLDIIARSIAQMLTERLGQSVIVDNRPGGATVLATELAAKGSPDGHTLFAGTDSLRIVGVTKRVAFDVRKAFDPIAPVSAQPYILIIHPSLPVKSIKELIAYSATQPISYGSSGIGTVAHLGLETFAAQSGAKLLHVPYKGGAQSLLALLAGEIQMYPGLILSANAAVKAGKARLLAACSLQRLPALPDLPTLAEQGFPGLKIVNSYNLYSPAGTPKPILNALNRYVVEYMHSPAVSQRLTAEGSQPGERMSPDEMRVYFAREYDEVERQVKQLKVKLY